MPSSNTLTSFYNFTANTKAKASEVNANFNAYRGHIFPIHPNTTTCIDLTYDLGSTDYRWNTVYQNKNYYGNTTTANITVEKDTATSTSELLIKVNNTEAARFLSTGLKRSSLEQVSLYTSVGTTFGSYYVTTGSSGIQSVFTLSITSSRGLPIEVGIMPYGITSSGYLAFETLISTTTGYGLGTYTVYRDGTAAANIVYADAIESNLLSGNRQSFPLGGFRFVDYNCSAGGHTYYFAIDTNVGSKFGILLYSIKTYAREIV